jgi:hypothetical protein
MFQNHHLQVSEANGEAPQQQEGFVEKLPGIYCSGRG